MSDTLLERLLLDAQEEFLAAIDHVPNPGRGGPIGSLNAAPWVIAHAATTHDAWINDFCAQQQTDPWADAWYEDANQNEPGTPIPGFQDARDAFERVAEQSSRWIEQVTWTDLLQPATFPQPPRAWHGAARGYLVARAIAHLYVHAGELSVIASLMAAGDLGLPGRLRHSNPPSEEDDPSVPVVAALLRDGFVEVRRVAEVVPTPAVEGAMDRLNPVSHTVAHLLGREDRFWNVVMREQEPNERLAALGATGEARPLPWDECLAAFDEVEASVAPWLEGVTPQIGATPMKWGDDSSVAAQIARSATHFFSHAGEMMAHASLYGAKDLGMPGALAHVRAATSDSSS